MNKVTAAESLTTREKLLDVAIDLFARNGFKGTSIRDIAREMDMTISNIYYYFGSKYGLLLAILEHFSTKLKDDVQRAVQTETEPLERFKLLVSTHLDQIRTDGRAAKLFLGAGRASPTNLPLRGEILSVKSSRKYFSIW